jgi:hypothetical protein
MPSPRCTLPLGTLRLYAHFDDPGDPLYLISPVTIEIITPGGGIGDLLVPWQLATDDPLGFYQHPLGGDTSASIDLAVLAANPDLAFDSWMTVGLETAAGNTLQQLFMDWTGFNAGSAIDEAQGSVFVDPFEPQGYPVEGRVLLAQITTGMDSSVSGTFNLQGVRANGMTYQVNAANFVFDVCATPADDLAYGLKTSAGWFPKFGVCGDLSAGGAAQLSLQRAPTNALAILFLSTSALPQKGLGGTIIPQLPFLPIQFAATADTNGDITLAVPGVGIVIDLVGQWLMADPGLPSGVAMSNALELHLGP